MTHPTPAETGRAATVRPVPVHVAVARFLPLWLPWLLVVVLGRQVCRVAQRLPPVVRLVRHLRARAGG